MENNINVVKDGFPFEITLENCHVVIKNGLAGTFKIHENAIIVDRCAEGVSVLCDSSDEKQYVTLIDFSKSRTGFTHKVTSLYPSNFGFSTGFELVGYISDLVGREVVSNCCLEDSNELTTEDVVCKK